MDVSTDDLIKKKAAFEYIADLRTARIREAQSKVKIYFNVTAGALVLSVSFLTVSGMGSIVFANILVSSWVFLIAAIVCNLVSYITVDLSFNNREKLTRNWISEGMNDQKIVSEVDMWAWLTRRLNFLSALSTIIGLLLLIAFGIYNINTMTDQNKKIITVDSNDHAEKHAEPSISGPSIADRISTSTPDGTSETSGDEAGK